MIAALAALLLAVAAQPSDPAPDEDAPVSTAVKIAPEADLPPVAPEPAEVKPSSESPAAPPSLAFEPKTLVDGETLQVVFGQRAVFLLDDHGLPVLDTVEEGQLAAAHPDGEVTETFTAPDDRHVAAALDGSAEKRATYLKVWNGLDHAIDYRAVVLVKHGETLTPRPVTVCAVPAGQARTQSWPAVIVAVGLARFKTATKAALAACKQGD